MDLDKKLHSTEARRLIFKNTTKSVMVSFIPILLVLICFHSYRDVFWTLSGTLLFLYHLCSPFTVKLNSLLVGYDDFSIKDVLISDIKRNSFKYVSAMAIYTVIVGLGTLLLIVPGIIKRYEYYFVPYIVSETPEMGIKEILTESKRLTKGYKMQLFKYDVSLILWYLLISLTTGIASLYVIPHINLTKAYMYSDLRFKSTFTEQKIEKKPYAYDNSNINYDDISKLYVLEELLEDSDNV